MSRAWTVALLVLVVFVVLVTLEVAGRSGTNPVGRVADFFTVPRVPGGTSPPT